MTEIEYATVNQDNCSRHSLDAFERTQQVNRQWRNLDGQWQRVERPFTDDWPLEKKRQVAAELLDVAAQGEIVFVALHGKDAVGFIYISAPRFGSQQQYTELDNMQVSRPWRHRGIGRQLFQRASAAARERGVPKMYISAQPSQESVAFYRALGCVDAQEINSQISAREPDDFPLEYRL